MSSLQPAKQLLLDLKPEAGHFVGVSYNAPSMEAFPPKSIVLITLNSPREKFWGSLLSVSGAGVSVRGIELISLDDFAHQIRAEEPVSTHTVFFPMHRVERMELDVRNGDIPSIQERFQSKSGKSIELLVES